MYMNRAYCIGFFNHALGLVREAARRARARKQAAVTQLQAEVFNLSSANRALVTRLNHLLAQVSSGTRQSVLTFISGTGMAGGLGHVQQMTHRGSLETYSYLIISVFEGQLTQQRWV